MRKSNPLRIEFLLDGIWGVAGTAKSEANAEKTAKSLNKYPVTDVRVVPNNQESLDALNAEARRIYLERQAKA